MYWRKFISIFLLFDIVASFIFRIGTSGEFTFLSSFCNTGDKNLRFIDWIGLWYRNLFANLIFTETLIGDKLDISALLLFVWFFDLKFRFLFILFDIPFNSISCLLLLETGETTEDFAAFILFFWICTSTNIEFSWLKLAGKIIVSFK